MGNPPKKKTGNPPKPKKQDKNHQKWEIHQNGKSTKGHRKSPKPTNQDPKTPIEKQKTQRKIGNPPKRWSPEVTQDQRTKTQRLPLLKIAKSQIPQFQNTRRECARAGEREAGTKI